MTAVKQTGAEIHEQVRKALEIQEQCHECPTHISGWYIEPATLDGCIVLTAEEREERDSHVRDIVYGLRNQPEISREDIANVLERALLSPTEVDDE